MDAGTLSVRKIFGQDRRHIVPLFQRPYVWEREKQWEPFWEDIRAFAERLSRNQQPRRGVAGPWKDAAVTKFKSIKKDKFTNDEIDSWYGVLVEAGLIEE